MAKEMLINVSEGEECRIALLEDGKLEELYMERTSSTSHVGNIYKGRVTNVEPSIQAAFIDFGLGRNGFLHISDLMPTYFGRRGEDIQESVGRKMARRDRPPIQRCLRRGDELIVQIIKEGIGTKGPTLSTYLSIPGKMLVMMPGMGKMGVSKKIEDDQERRRLRQILDGLKPPKDVAFIIRTAGIGKTKLEIERDLKYLTRLWETLKKKEKEPGPVELYTEGDLVTRTVRDVFSTDVDQIIVDNKEVAKRVKEVIKISSPRAKNKVELYEEPIPLFHKFGIEKEIELMYSRHVPLPSGGSLVIDSTEAIVAIDVNSGKNRDNNDAEMTAFKTDMEAADEIPRQLKLRDLGGVIICDFIDLRYERHRRDLEKRLHDNFQNDRAKTKVLRMSQFGIIELTRQRMRPSLKRSIYFDCPHCKGAGLVKTPESMSLDVMRKLAIALNDLKVVRAELSVCPDIAFYLLNKKRSQLTELEERTKKKILIRTDAALGLDELKFELFDLRDGMVILEEIGMTLPTHPHTTQLGVRPSGHTHQGRGGRPGDQRGPQQRRDNRGGRNDRRPDQRPQPTRAAEADREEMDEDRIAIERGEDAVDEREEQMGYAPTVVRDVDDREQDHTGPEILETESMDEVAEDSVVEPKGNRRPDPRDQRPPGGPGGGPGGPVGEGEGGPRRRRRRRGRRGRGRGQGQGQGNNAGQFNDRPGEPSRESQPQSDADRGDDEFSESTEAPQEIAPIDEETPGNEAEVSPAAATSETGDQPRRRRRRRGGRRHRRGGANRDGSESNQNGEPAAAEAAEEPEPIAEVAEPEVEEVVIEAEVEEKPAPPPKRRGRAPARSAPHRVPPTKAAAAKEAKAAKESEEEVPVVRTGSADKHLVVDEEPAADEHVEPVESHAEAAPVRAPYRPRSYRDLDAIPDDYD
jgi:ribonuclease E